MGTITSRPGDPRGNATTKSSRVALSRLSKQDAWDIAVMWREQLQGCVRLETDPQQDPFTIIPRFEWVTFMCYGDPAMSSTQGKNPNKTAAFARAQTIAWFALSCCDGFSGTQNPQFWRRVFSEFAYTPHFHKQQDPRSYHANTTRPQRSMTDAVRFFDCADNAFPRVRLVLGGHSSDKSSSCERIFLGLEPSWNIVRDRQLQRILKTLTPFIRASLWARSIPVALEQVGMSSLETALHDEATHHQTTARKKDQPRMHIQSAFLRLNTHTTLDELAKRLPPTSRVEVVVNGSLFEVVQRQPLCRVLSFSSDRHDDQQDPQQHHHQQRWPCWRIASLRLRQPTEVSNSHLGALCSALPFLPSTAHVQLPPTTYNAVALTEDWAWLGYAIFHPDTTARSSFTSLEVALKGVAPSDLNALASMASGNNLLLGSMHSTTETTSQRGSSTAYYEGRVHAGTHVRLDPLDQSKWLYTFTSPTWIGLCISSSDELLSEPWIRVVARGVGLGWMRQSEITDVRSRSPASSCLRALCINSLTVAHDDDSICIGLLSILGDQLTSLEIQSNDLMSATTVHNILCLCPSLRSLRIRHDGSFWSDPAFTLPTPHLQELELMIDGRHRRNHRYSSMRPLDATCLPHLQALRVISCHQGSWPQHEAKLLSLLRESRTLQYLHWSCSDWSPTDPMQPTLYETLHKATHALQLKCLYSAIPDVAQGPLSIDCRLAFLSVIRAASATTTASTVGPLALVAQELVELIFAFATTSVPREIYISLQ